MNAADLADYVAHFRYRVLQDALNEGTRTHWLRRAETFEQAKPRLGEFHGQATKAELSARWRSLDEMAKACRNRAAMALIQDEHPELVVDLLAEAQGGGPVWDREPTQRAS